MKNLLANATQRLTEAGCDSPAREARLLLEAALELSHWALAPQSLTPTQQHAYELLLARRCLREPLAQILGRKAFWGLDFFVNRHTLTPRPDSETVVEAALAHLPDKQAPYFLLDLGTGSGCLLLALLHERPNATGIGIDRSKDALAVAAQNAQQLKLTARVAFACSDWANAVNASFDMILSNPPYIPHADIAGLMPEVRDYEPATALDGGADGLDDYRRILADAPRLLTAGGHILCELGIGQATDVQQIGLAAGLYHRATRPDLGGIDRAIVFSLLDGGTPPYPPLRASPRSD